MVEPTTRPARRLCDGDPACITVYANAQATRGGELVEFESLADLWDMARKPERPGDKRAARLYARAEVDGKRFKKNLVPPFMVVLDVDGVDVPIDEAVARLDLLGVAAVAHTTWSHGKKKDGGRHSYRVLTDMVADTWGEVEHVTRELFEQARLEPTRESWHSACFFVPATPEGTRREFRARRTKLDESEWEPPPYHPPDPRDLRDSADREVDPEDEKLVRDALPHVPNADRDDWIAVGMALKSSGIEDARDLFDEWSAGQDYPDFSVDENDRVWASFSDDEPGGVGVGTILHLARRAGWRRPDEKADPVEDFFEFLSPRERQLRLLNQGHAFVAIGKGVVADTADPERPIDFLSREAFVGLHRFPRVSTGERKQNGDPVLAPVGKVWLEGWRKRRTFRRVDFLPEGGPDELPDDTLNLWRGWPPLPEGPGSATRWLDHVRDNVCRGDDELWSWTLAWMAHLVQRPFDKVGTALVMRGTEGVGKGVVASALVELAGPHGLHVTQPRQLTGNFNSHMESKLVVFADEVTWGGRVQEEGVLKSIITEKTVMVEPKGVDAFQARSFCRVVISSNNDWIVPAGRTARRYQVMDVHDRRQQDRDYFQPIVEDMKTGGLRDLRERLGRVDLRELPDPGRIVSTDALRDQKVESLDSRGSWLLSALYAGALDDFGAGWPSKPVPVSDLRDSYLSHARERGGAQVRSIEMQVNAFLREVLGPAGLEVKRVGKRRLQHYVLPSLADSRAAFEKWLGSSVDWS